MLDLHRKPLRVVSNMETSNLETLIDSLESIGLERKYVVIEIDEYNKQADLDFTEEAHDNFCETPELLMSVL